MASDSESVRVTMLREVLHKITVIIATKCNKNVSSITKKGPAMVRQSTRPIYGDICIPGGVVKMYLPTEQHVEEVIEAIMAASESLDFPVLTCSPAENDFISIKLQRAPTFSRVINHIMKEGNEYGHQRSRRDKAVLLNVPEIPKREKEDDGVGLSSLRQRLLAQHVSALLEANGYHVHQGYNVNTGNPSSTVDKILGDIIPEGSLGISSRATTERDLPPGYLKELSTSKYVSSVACQTDEERDHQQSPDQCHLHSSQDGFPKQCSVDLAAVLKHQKLRIGKGGYSKNMTEVQLTDTRGVASPVLKQCVNLKNAIEEMKSSDNLHILHAVPASQEFLQQQVDLTMRALSQDGHSSDHSHLCCAPVQLTGGKRQGKGMDVEEFYDIRYSQMREASVMKYGDQVKGDSWNDMIHSVTAAGIKFDILGTHFRHPVKLDVGERNESNPWPDNRNGVFVMYNYARLSTLFTRFQEEVHKGTYPALPPVEDTDFSTLKEEAEWKLLFSHILTLPDVILESVGERVTTPQELACKFETHKICRYLVSLSQDLSTYYGRFRILVEPRPHLLPTMFARIYLLKAVHQVLGNGLALLKITPLTQM
ncbi:DALR anticodon-binding domain-containing protein 3 [Strongylocentrotus purpuratus]|uniref:DALR anticodon binding domain-containing protein n=1 Tax=Strongylocentrotus purpuratus TaxID=7668 RepID=A0A7M7G3Z7_STRPU|nr:DALR anticodon-binding domain-containing protein 3 [Strongylocentrotus purpuratus]